MENTSFRCAIYTRTYVVRWAKCGNPFHRFLFVLKKNEEVHWIISAPQKLQPQRIQCTLAVHLNPNKSIYSSRANGVVNANACEHHKLLVRCQSFRFSLVKKKKNQCWSTFKLADKVQKEEEKKTEKKQRETNMKRSWHVFNSTLKYEYHWFIDK